MLLVGSFLALFFNPEDGGSTFLQNVCELIPDYIVLHHRTPYSSMHYVFHDSKCSCSENHIN
jgi:hypothetical protein